MSDDIVARYQNVSKSYNGLTVVKDLTFEIKRGEFLSLLGPSGSGKTTTLMMLAGLQSPSSGHIYLNDALIDGIPPHRRNIGVVFQNYALFPHMTIAENLAYPLRARHMQRDEIRQRVNRGLEMVKLEKLAERRPSELSGGQQQRVALARALVFNPSVVLLDEPLGALDRQLRENMQIELKQLHRETAVTMIYVTHDQSEAMTMSDRVAVFNGGEILQCASPRELYDEPSCSFVAEFVGENNRISGRISERNGDIFTIRTMEGITIKVNQRPGFAIGDAVHVYLRPERIVVGPAAMNCENHYSAKIADAVFIGDHTKLRLDFPGCPDLIAKQNYFGNGCLPRRAEQIHVGWSIEAPRIVPA